MLFSMLLANNNKPVTLSVMEGWARDDETETEKPRVNGGTDNDSLTDSHKYLRCR